METKHCGKCKIEKELNEFCFRYNERNNDCVFDKLVKQCVL